MHCWLCEWPSGVKYSAQEMMFGLGGDFTYWECGRCGCLRLLNPPTDWSSYYPSNYYSFNGAQKPNPLRKAIDYLRTTDTPFLSPLIRRYRPDFTMMSLAPLNRSMRVLDVGCGSGQIVYRLRQLGIHAVGCDPFVSSDSVLVHKCTLGQMSGTFDVVLLSHSLEHMAEQEATMRDIAKHLSPLGRAVIRIPIADHLWKTLRNEWTELDAPRHLFIHTIASFHYLANRAGLSVERTIMESPGGRASFILKNSAQLPLTAIAETLDTSEDACVHV